MEATGHYWYPIYSFLKAKGYTICVINPIQSDSLRKMYIRDKPKTIQLTLLIAEVIRFSGQFGLLPWLMKTSLPCVSYVVIVILSFLPELKLSLNRHNYGTNLPRVRKTVFFSLGEHIHGHLSSGKVSHPRGILRMHHQ